LYKGACDGPVAGRSRNGGFQMRLVVFGHGLRHLEGRCLSRHIGNRIIFGLAAAKLS